MRPSELFALVALVACERADVPRDRAQPVHYGSTAWRMIGSVDALAFAGDRAIVVAAHGGAIARFDATTGQRTLMLGVPRGLYDAAQLDDRTLAVLAEESIALDLETGRTRPLPLGDKGSELAVSGKRAVMDSAFESMRVVDLASGSARQLERSRGFTHASITGDKVIASAGEAAGIWNLESGRREAVFATSGAFALTRTGKIATSYAGKAGTTIDLFELDGRELARLSIDCKPSLLVFSPDEQQLAAGCEERIVVLDIASGKKLADLATSRGFLLAMRWSPSGKLLAAGGTDGVVHVWDERWHARTQIAGARGEVARLAADGRTLVTCSWSANSSWTWDADTGKPLADLGRDVRAVAIDDAHEVLLSVDEPPRIERRSRDGKALARHDVGDGIVNELGPVAGHGAWQLENGVVTIFDAKLAPLWSSPSSDELLNAQAIASADGRRIVLYATSQLSILDGIERKVLVTMPTPTCGGEELDVADDASRIASVDETGIRIFDPTQATLVASLGAPSTPFDGSRSLAFAGKDRVLAIIDENLVDWTIGAPRATWRPMPDVVRLLVHGDLAYLAHRDGTVERRRLSELVATSSVRPAAKISACPPKDEGEGWGYGFGSVGGGEPPRGKLDDSKDYEAPLPPHD